SSGNSHPSPLHESVIASVKFGRSNPSFPLTPALSLRERENRQPAHGLNARCWIVEATQEPTVESHTRFRLDALFPLTPAFSMNRREASLLSPTLSSRGGEGERVCRRFMTRRAHSDSEAQTISLSLRR